MLGALDAENKREPNKTSTATLRSPETELTAEADGGDAVPTTAETHGELDDDTEPNRERKGVGGVRTLTTKRTGGSARSEAACGGRNRR